MRSEALFAALLAVGAAACGSNAAVPTYNASSVPGTATSTVTFAVCSDMRPRVRPWRTETKWATEFLMAHLAKEKPAFVLNTGDLVAWGDLDTSWRTFDRFVRPLRAAGVRYVPALGNHEYMGRNGPALDHYFRRFPDLARSRWHRFTAGPLAILVLDSNFDDLSGEDQSAQVTWLTDTLAAVEQDAAVRHVLVVAHHPAYSNGHHGPELRVREQFVPPLAKSTKVRAVVAGHAHSYERFVIDGLPFIVSGGCGAPLKPVAIAPDDADWRTKPVFEGPSERGHHYLDCSAGPSRLGCVVREVDRAGKFTERDRFVFTATTKP